MLIPLMLHSIIYYTPIYLFCFILKADRLPGENKGRKTNEEKRSQGTRMTDVNFTQISVHNF